MNSPLRAVLSTPPCAKLALAAVALLFSEGTGFSQVDRFVPPPGIQKYSFYPQAGNWFGDLFPNTSAAIPARAAASTATQLSEGENEEGKIT
jgi:hypothetical protein